MQESPIHITEKAMKEIMRMREELNAPANYYLRAGISGGGCAGFNYLLGFDTKKDQDELYDLGGIKLLIDKRHAMHVLGMEIDFETEDGVAGFVFNNPVFKATDQ